MTDYSDIPQVNALYAQRETITQMIGYIDSGGIMTYFTVSPPPMTNPMQPVMGMPVSTSVFAVKHDTMMALRTWCVDQQADIDAQLAAMGVENQPEPSPPDPPPTVDPTPDKKGAL